MRRLTALRERADDGAVAVLVAVLLSGGVLLGMGALVIDIGTLAVEREELQGGADAAAWAVAATCAADATAADCLAPGPLAARFADANAKDGSAGVTVTVCRDACAAAPGPPSCPPAPAALAGGIAQVGTSTLTADGSAVLPPILAQAMGYPGTTVRTCSQVVWGVAGRGTVLGAGVGLCAWQASTGGDPERPAGTDVQLSQDLPCPSSTAPQFTWVGAAADCAPTVAVGDVVARSDGTGCAEALAAARDSGRPVLVPIVDRTGPDGYHVVGLGGFVVTDYTLFSPGDIGGLPPPGCTPDTTCITGHFDRTTVPAHASLPGSTDDYGATVLSRIG